MANGHEVCMVDGHEVCMVDGHEVCMVDGHEVCMVDGHEVCMVDGHEVCMVDGHEVCMVDGHEVCMVDGHEVCMVVDLIKLKGYFQNYPQESSSIKSIEGELSMSNWQKFSHRYCLVQCSAEQAAQCASTISLHYQWRLFDWSLL